tara:strand:- start:114 stop:506 length:393 start_codon:yes stop_codon:yes gene_type:complete
MNTKEDNIKQKLFIKGIEAFNNNAFYDAHEYWEDLWSDYRLKDAKFIQALIQLSVGYFHITNMNFNGAKGLLNKCLPKFDLYRPNSRGLNVDSIINAVQDSLENLNNIENIIDFNWKLVPKLNIDDSRTV